MVDGGTLRLGDGVYWIDDEAKWHRIDPTSPHEYIRNPIPEEQEHLAYRWMGMVRAEVRGQALALKWDVRNVVAASLDAARRYLLRARPADTHLDFFHCGWNAETYADAREADCRIAQTRSFRAVDFIAPLTATPVVPAACTEADVRSAKLPLLDRAGSAWAASNGVWDRDRPLSWLARDILVMEPPQPGQEAMVVRHMGADHAVTRLTARPAERWAGEVCHFEWLSREQTRRLMVAYMEVARTGIAHSQDVRSLVSPAGQEPVWIPYRRLLLPVRDAAGKLLIATVSQVRQDIAIPFMGRAA